MVMFLTYDIQKKNLDEDNIDVDYKWSSCIWDGFGLEHIWKIILSILYGK